MGRDGESVRQSTSLHSISHRFLRFIGRFRRRRMDDAAVGCRYFGLGDDRPYFHPSTPISSPASSRSACVYVYPIPIYIEIFRIRELSDRFYVRSNDRLFEPTGNSLTAAFHRKDLLCLSVFHPSLSLSLSLSLSFFLITEVFRKSTRR